MNYTAGITNPLALLHLLQAICFKKEALCEISDKGLNFHVTSHCLITTSLCLPKSLFGHFYLNRLVTNEEGEEEGITMFYFGLDSLLHCLRICEGCEGSLLKCEWDYDHARKSWIIRIEVGENITHYCELTVRESPILGMENLLTFKSTPSTQRILIKSGWLLEALAEFDREKCELLQLVMQSSRNLPALVLIADSPAGSLKFDYFMDSEVIEAVHLPDQGIFLSRYKLADVKTIQKSLKLSNKTCVRRNEYGFLCFQMMIPVAGQTIMIETTIAPLED